MHLPAFPPGPFQGTLPLIAGSIILLFALNYYLSYRRVLKSFQDHPGIKHFFPTSGLIGNVLPHIPGLIVGRNWPMRLKHKPYAEAGWDVITTMACYPRIRADLILADPLAIKEVTLSRARFPKPVKQYTLLSFFGQNIVITEGEEWKRHRKISAPAFSERNNKLVWDETVRIVLDMFDNWGANNPEVTVDHCVDITLPIALLVIGVAGFGRRVTWAEDKLVPAGHKFSFKDALHNVSTYVHFKLVAPRWAYRFSNFLRDVQTSFDELDMYMREMIAFRKASEVKEERYDLFSALLDASEEEDTEGAKLTDSELIGNIFIFLIAGHETTAHTLCFCFGMLALEQDEQEKLYQHIMSVIPAGSIPNYDLMNSLTYSMAVFYETMRIFPPVNNIPKESAEDTTIPAIRPDGTKGVVAVPKGTQLTLNITGLHYNPRYWPDPEAFKPERFLGDWPRDAFLPFSAGARACLGRRFFETEGIAILTMLVSRYKIELRNPELYDGLTQMEKRAKLLASRPGLTLTPLSVPLVFKRR